MLWTNMAFYVGSYPIPNQLYFGVTISFRLIGWDWGTLPLADPSP